MVDMVFEVGITVVMVTEVGVRVVMVTEVGITVVKITELTGICFTEVRDCDTTED